MKKVDPQDRVVFWFPVLLPVLMGLILSFAELVADLGATAIAAPPEDVTATWSLIVGDLSNFWLASSKNISSAVFAIDIWALTTLFTLKGVVRTSAVYAYPVLGIFLHFLLLMMIVGASALSGGFEANHALHAMSGGDSNADLLLAFAMKVLAFSLMIMAIVVGWFVRRGIWIHHESVSHEPFE